MGRIKSLDALRGLAALVVLFYHLSLVYDRVNYLMVRTYVPRILVAGHSAVLVFFALSGFVLFASLKSRDRFRYLPYLVKRLLRLYPPLLVAVLGSAVLYVLVSPQPIPGLSRWFNVLSWQYYPDRSLIGGHLLLLDDDRYHSLDNVIWSLVHEIRISIIFPLLAWGIVRRPNAVLAASVAISAICVFALLHRSSGQAFDPMLTLQYLFLFAAGAWLAHHAEQVRAFFAARSFGPYLLAAIILLCLPGGGWWQFAASIGAILLVALSFASPAFEDALGWAPLDWLGKRSYSLYLVHIPLLLTMVHALHGVVATWIILLTFLPIALLAAELFYRFVERPSIELSRYFGRRLMRGGSASEAIG